MNIISLIAVALLALIQYASKRSFGMPVIGLIIGNIIAALWAEWLGSQLVQLTGTSEVMLTQNITHVIVVVLPALSLVMVGRKTKSALLRVGGALLFAGFAALLLYEPVEAMMTLNEYIDSGLQDIMPFRNTIIGIMAIAATVDVVLHTTSRRSR